MSAPVGRKFATFREPKCSIRRPEHTAPAPHPDSNELNSQLNILDPSLTSVLIMSVLQVYVILWSLQFYRSKFSTLLLCPMHATHHPNSTCWKTQILLPLIPQALRPSILIIFTAFTCGKYEVGQYSELCGSTHFTRLTCSSVDRECQPYCFFFNLLPDFYSKTN